MHFIGQAFVFVLYLIASSSCTVVLDENDYDAETLLQNEGFDTFLELAIENYQNWLREHNFDPSPPIQGPGDLSTTNTLVNLTCFISNYQVDGISRSNMRLQGVSGNLLNGHIIVRFHMYENITFYGDYTANGTVLSSIPLNGEGKWVIVYEELEQEFQFQNFAITPDGFINLTAASFYQMSLLNGEMRQFQFEGLLDNGAGGFENEVKSTIVEKLKSFLYGASDNYGYPGVDLFYQYFLEIFSKTPISEIIGTTRPPTEEPTSTVTVPPSTDEPCWWHGSGYKTEVTLSSDLVEHIAQVLPDFDEVLRNNQNKTLTIYFNFNDSKE